MNILKKILFILHYPPPVHGAALVGEYIKSSEIINQAFDCKYINLSTSVAVNEIGKNGFSKWKRFFKIMRQSYNDLGDFRPDLVYITLTTTGIGFYKDAVIVLMVKAFNVPLVYHFHNKGVRSFQDRWFDNFIYKKIFKKVDVIILSKYLYPDIKKYVPLKRVHYCPNGIPKSDFRIKSEFRLRNERPVQILFLSNLIKSKGVYLLLEACQVLKEQQLDFECTFVGGEGDITAKEFQESIYSSGLEKQVCYAGRKYGQEKEEAYLNADIFVLPTTYKNECFPLVLLEAMQYSLPVISTNEGGIPEIVENGVTGFVIENQSVVKLSKKLGKLIKDPELRIKMGSEGRARYLKNFTQEKFEQQLSQVINTIIKK